MQLTYLNHNFFQEMRGVSLVLKNAQCDPGCKKIIASLQKFLSQGGPYHAHVESLDQWRRERVYWHQPCLQWLFGVRVAVGAYEHLVRNRG